MPVAIPTEYVPEFNEILAVLTKSEGSMRRINEEVATQILNALVGMRSALVTEDIVYRTKGGRLLTDEYIESLVADGERGWVKPSAVDEPVEPVDEPPADMLDWTDLADTGLLWLINASVFHPRGLAMALHFTGDVIDRGEAVGWKLIPAGPGEAFSYLQRSPDHPEGIDIDDCFRRSEAFIEGVRGQDPTHYLDADPVGYVPPEDGAVYINDEGQGSRYCARCVVWFEVQDVLDQSEHVHIDR